MLPAVVARRPAALSRCATSAVVVVLPLVPVIAMLRVPGCKAARAEAEIELGDDLHAGMPRGGQNRCVRRDTRRDHYTGGLANLVDVVAADFDVDPRHTLQRFGGRTGVGMVGRVARIDAQPFARQQPRGGDATLA